MRLDRSKDPEYLIFRCVYEPQIEPEIGSWWNAGSGHLFLLMKKFIV
jgi:hypothetical protein